MRRSKAQLEQDRADILAVLQDATAPMWLADVIGAAQGLRPNEWPDELAQGRGLTDLGALARQGLVISDRRWPTTNSRWSLVTDGVLTQREQRDDELDVERMYRGWELADEEAP